MSRFSRGQSGFSLIQVLIAVGIMAGAALAFATMLQQFYAGQKGIEFKIEADDLTAEVKSNLSFESVCKANLNTAFIDAVEIPVAPGRLSSVEIEVKRLHLPDVPPPDNLFLKAGAIEGYLRLDVESAWFKDFKKINDNQYRARLHIRYVAKSQVTGPQKLVRTIPIFFRSRDIGGGREELISCSALNASLARDLANLLSQVKYYEDSTCARTSFVRLTASCGADEGLLGCTGGPGDLHEAYEGYVTRPDFVDDKCVMEVHMPRCWSGAPRGAWQTVIAICYPLSI